MPRADLAALSVFATVAERCSFRAAARELGLSPSAVSHAVSALEARLGVRLLARTTRSVAPTEAGRALLRELQPALAGIDTAVGQAMESGAKPSGLLRITVPRSVVEVLILPRLGDFVRAYPGITVELHAENGLIDIVAQGFDAGLRFGESLNSEMIAVPFGPRQQRLVAIGAPSLLAKRPPPRHPRDLADHPCIAMRLTSGALYAWEMEKDGEAVDVAVTGPLIFNDNRLILAAVIQGLGFGFILEGLAAPAIEQGEIVRIMEDWCPVFPGFFLYYLSRRQMRPALRAFIDFFSEAARPSSERGLA
ncbi:LysR family transcriptional regulator [Methylobacterium brachythecii]|uniref:DNA-binding transcriptional LysR family regulator n=1 Tax=Methylobacterium brachythecii TaxID=1176177 RepID=A0A7W6F559_9HYPH|nr:LysR family transcriptional regulator [Methylobacterium brachythecii]MBB3901055.1 DNA-binding transcriptional LysR family regulator [Methylobacterium brachythecii]GLS46633.1 LysR family transcriptional regulator [Methylobacterium brachythecii]